MNFQPPEEDDPRDTDQRYGAEEAYLRQCLAELHKSYLRDAQPYIDRLCKIIAESPIPPIMVMMDQLSDEMRQRLTKEPEK
jgi:hypothetical protein